MEEKVAKPARAEKPASAPSVDIPNVHAVPKDELLNRVRECFDKGMRLVTLTGFDRGETREVMYHFDKDLELLHLSVSLACDEELPSITPVYDCAFLAENEVKELFGINITNISIDYHGRLLIAENCPAAPMLKELTTPAVNVIRTRSSGAPKTEPDAAQANAAPKGEN
jgi:ech hydrogenase subunit D